MRCNYFRKKIYILVILISAVLLPGFVRADRTDELEKDIGDKNQQIQEIQKDINKFAEELTGIRTEKRTLKNAVNELDVSRRKVSANINLTQSEIDNAFYSIEKLGIEINEKKSGIQLNNEAISQTIRLLNEIESQTLVEIFLGYDNLSEFWDELDSLEQIQIVMQKDLRELYLLKEQSEINKEELQIKERELSQLQIVLVGQRAVIDTNKSQKDQLLEVTENEEAKFQSLLAEKIRQRKIFERELASIEDALRIAIDPDSIPSSGGGVLAWPLDDVLITQYFGNTTFATANPQVYSGGGHNGIDLGISNGTKVKSALSGNVTATGNTDLQRGCFSYGKWVLIKHNNGLSSLYAHLSVISVNPGQSVKTGDLVGFSGNTGYSTGPHLHFTVFASEGVQVVRLGDVKAVTNCGNMKIPIAPKEAYLNPLSYL